MRNATSQEELTAAVGDIQRAWNEVVPTLVLGGVAEYIAWNDDVHGVVPSLEAVMFLDGVYRDG